jgi:hypothetical protein
MTREEMKKIGHLIAVVMIIGSFYSCSDVVTEKYKSYEEASRGGAVKRGWLPAFVPKSATDITLAHDLDTNYQWLRFRIPTNEIEAMDKNMRSISFSEARKTGVNKSTPIKDWPPELQAPLLITPRGSLHFFSTKVEIGLICLCVDVTTGETFGWTCKGGS